MIRPPNNFILTASLILVALLLHLATSSHTITYLPAPLLLAIIFTWTKSRPWRYLLVLAIFTELFSLAPAGLSTLTVFIPLAVHRLRGRFDVDLSFSFIFLLLTTTFIQILLQLSPLLLFSYHSYPSLVTALTHLPLRPLSLTIISITMVAFVTILAIHNLKPRRNDNVISLDRQRLGIIS